MISSTTSEPRTLSQQHLLRQCQGLLQEVLSSSHYLARGLQSLAVFVTRTAVVLQTDSSCLILSTAVLCCGLGNLGPFGVFGGKSSS